MSKKIKEKKVVEKEYRKKLIKKRTLIKRVLFYVLNYEYPKITSSLLSTISVRQTLHHSVL